MITIKFLILAILCHGHEGVQVTVTQGILEGAQVPFVFGNGSYYSFIGIPYAAPPIGELRFQSPQPPLKWTGARSALQHGNVCLQEGGSGNEDCLFLNVYTTTLENQKLPVMVYIHGGGFVGGSGNSDFLGPDFLLQHNIVLVTLNYRLGPLGFISLGTEKVPGNAAFKDQVAAFKWVRDNIAKFGGNSGNVTIFGQSAGAVSVSLHMVSPMSAGLFQRAIAMSGTALMEGTVPFKSETRAFAIGRLLGFDTKRTDELYRFLIKVDGSALVGLKPCVLANEENTYFSKTTYNTYTVEKNFGGDNFLTMDPLLLLKNKTFNKADFMTGHTNNEYLTFFSSDAVSRYAQFRELFAPKRVLYSAPPETSLKVADALETYYFGDKPVNDAPESFLRFMNDVAFCYDLYKYLTYLGESPGYSRYLYQFSAVSGRNLASQNIARKLNIASTAGHTDDLYYLFNQPYNVPKNKDSIEYKLVQKYTTLFTNFAKYGNPTPPWIKNDEFLGDVIWPSYSTTTKQYLEFNTNSTNVNINLDSSAIQLFNKVYAMTNIGY